eukprot:271530-Hanusia_phi.AAC.1
MRKRERRAREEGARTTMSWLQQRQGSEDEGIEKMVEMQARIVDKNTMYTHKAQLRISGMTIISRSPRALDSKSTSFGMAQIDHPRESFGTPSNMVSQLLSVFTPPPGIFPVPHWAAITDREDRLTMEDGVPRRDFWGTVRPQPASLSDPDVVCSTGIPLSSTCGAP